MMRAIINSSFAQTECLPSLAGIRTWMALNRRSRPLGCDDRLSNSKFFSTDSISQADTEVASDHPIGQNQQQQQPQIQQH